MTDETTTEKLAEIDRDMADIERQVAELVEEAQQADYPQPQPQPEPVQVREGRWRTRGGDIRNVTSTPECDNRHDRFPWRDTVYDQTWTPNGRYQFNCEESPFDLVTYLGPIEQQPESQPESQPEPESDEQIRLLKECNARQAELIADLKYERSGAMERAEVSARSSRKLTEQIEELRSEVSYVQNLLGTERRRVTELEELVASLRTINEGAEKAVSGAGVVNDSLRLQLEAVKAEVVQERLERNRWHNQVLRVTAELNEKTTQCEILQIELDAAHQVPADSPELRQLRADLAEVIQDRDTYRHAHELLVQDVNATHQRTKVMTVEAIVEWLVPIRTCGSQALATAVISNLPQIMRTLTGLDSHAID